MKDLLIIIAAGLSGIGGFVFLSKKFGSDCIP